MYSDTVLLSNLIHCNVAYFTLGRQYKTAVHTIWKTLLFPLALRLKERFVLFPVSIACCTH